MNNNVTFLLNKPRKMENRGIEKSDLITKKLYILLGSICYSQ